MILQNGILSLFNGPDEEDQCFFYLNRQRGFFSPTKV